MLRVASWHACQAVGVCAAKQADLDNVHSFIRPRPVGAHMFWACGDHLLHHGLMSDVLFTCTALHSLYHRGHSCGATGQQPTTLHSTWLPGVRSHGPVLAPNPSILTLMRPAASDAADASLTRTVKAADHHRYALPTVVWL